MSNKNVWVLIFVGLAISMMIPVEVFAAKSDVFGGKEIMKAGVTMRSFIFDVAIPFGGGIFAGIYSFKALSQNNYQVAGAFLLLAGALMFVVPAFINGTYGTSALIP